MNWSRIISTILVAGCVAGIVGMPQMLSGYIFVVIPLGLWLVVVFVDILKSPERRKTRWAQLIVWSIALSVVGSLHFYYAKTARANADKVLAALLQFESERDSFPKNISELEGIDAADVFKWKISYGHVDGRPNLAYFSTSAMFDSYSYNFESKTWEHNVD